MTSSTAFCIFIFSVLYRVLIDIYFRIITYVLESDMIKIVPLPTTPPSVFLTQPPFLWILSPYQPHPHIYNPSTQKCLSCHPSPTVQVSYHTGKMTYVCRPTIEYNQVAGKTKAIAEWMFILSVSYWIRLHIAHLKTVCNGSITSTAVLLLKLITWFFPYPRALPSFFTLPVVIPQKFYHYRGKYCGCCGLA